MRKEILTLSMALALMGGGNAAFAQETDLPVDAMNAEMPVEANAEAQDDQNIQDEGYGADDEYYGAEEMENAAVDNQELGEENASVESAPEVDTATVTNAAQ